MLERAIPCVFAVICSATALCGQEQKNGSKPEECPSTERAANDDRCTFEASAFVGISIDTFAAGSVRRYLNPAAADGKQESAIGGIDFAYRLRGWRKEDGSDSVFSKQLWVLGETIHGVRSADIDCSANANLPTCQKSLTGFTTTPGDNWLYILRNASSLEGYLGLRWEFLPLNNKAGSGGTSANLYLKAQAGFLKVSGSPDSALDLHRLSAGAIATTGKWADSYLEVGYGRSDTFQIHRRRRVLVDAYLQRDLTILHSDYSGMSFFTQIVVDTDLGYGADSVQTYIGVNFDIGKLFGQPKKAASKP